MNGYTVMYGTIFKFDYTTCQMLIIMIKLIEHARWSSFWLPTRIFMDDGEERFFYSSSLIVLGDDIFSICIKNNNKWYNHGQWFVMTARTNAKMKKHKLIGGDGILCYKDANRFVTFVSKVCKRRLNELLAYCISPQCYYFYFNIQKNNYNTEKTIILGSRSFIIPYWSQQLFVAYQIYKCVKLIRNRGKNIIPLDYQLTVDCRWLNKTNKIIELHDHNSWMAAKTSVICYNDRYQRLMEIKYMIQTSVARVIDNPLFRPIILA